MNDYTFINFTFIRLNYIWALAPSFMKIKGFINLHYKGWKQTKDNNINGDPEHLLGKYFLNQIPFDCKNLKNISIINQKYSDSKTFPCFEWINSKIIFLDKKINPNYRKNEIKCTDILDFIKNDYVFIRISPTFVIDGVNYGRNYMKKINLKKWEKGNTNVSYENIE